MSALDLEVVSWMIQDSLKTASSRFKLAVSVAVCDRRGFLIGFARDREAKISTIDSAQRKAFTAVQLGSSTLDSIEAWKRNDARNLGYYDFLLSSIPGGAPVRDSGGAIIGGIGVSSDLSASDDQKIADLSAEVLSNIVSGTQRLDVQVRFDSKGRAQV
ncbi:MULTISPECIES: heme-binding protein [Burkholderiaceae]|uniref:GlcG protein n=1 Tax=Caballeronia zhejiangensis TaxID=871203 RepID=A0A656QAG6_9BURK|nr:MULTISPECIES: heme-binding protein [Burkholderiaceae]KAK42499.1 hypothetical protein BG58_41505 [Caballeronia jiangsuensis]KDR26120.1 hypothetical protein BG60_24150 [Caballeronia zhejiangensis]